MMYSNLGLSFRETLPLKQRLLPYGVQFSPTMLIGHRSECVILNLFSQTKSSPKQNVSYIIFGFLLKMNSEMSVLHEICVPNLNNFS